MRHQRPRHGVALAAALDARDAVARQDRRSVVELQPVAERQRPIPAVVLDRVSFQHQRVWNEVLVATIQRLVDHAGEVAGDQGRCPNRIEAGQVRLRDVDQRA